MLGVITTVPVGEICQVSKSPAAGVNACAGLVSLQLFAAAVIVQVSASAVAPSNSVTTRVLPVPGTELENAYRLEIGAADGAGHVTLVRVVEPTVSPISGT